MDMIVVPGTLVRQWKDDDCAHLAKQVDGCAFTCSKGQVKENPSHIVEFHEKSTSRKMKKLMLFLSLRRLEEHASFKLVKNSWPRRIALQGLLDWNFPSRINGRSVTNAPDVYDHEILGADGHSCFLMLLTE